MLISAHCMHLSGSLIAVMERWVRKSLLAGSIVSELATALIHILDWIS